MTYENLRLNGTSQKAFDKYNGFYYIMDHTTGALLVRTDDGQTSFLYPLDVTVSNSIIELQYDGYYFWSMEQITNGVRISKWYTQNYLCKQQDTFDLTTTVDENYGTTTDMPDTFAVEHYHRVLTSGVAVSGTYVVLDSVDYLDAGDTPVIHIGPNSSGQFEEQTITSVGPGNQAHFGAPGLTYSYGIDDEVQFSRRIWLFNKHYGTVTNNYHSTSSDAASLIEFDLSGNLINTTKGTEYSSVTASTFAAYNYYNGSTVKPFLFYMKNSLLNFIDVSSVLLPISLSSVQDVYKHVDPTAQWAVYSICIEDNFSDQIPVSGTALKRDTIYRLQDGATYVDTDYGWSGTNLNYAITTIKPFVNSISVSTVPAVIPADSGLTKSEITAHVKDQYNTEVVGIEVTFTENDSSGGVVSPGTDNTDAEGAAHTEFSSGSEDKVVTITASVDQIII